MKSDAIQAFENLTSEIEVMEQAKAFKLGLTHEDRQRLEMHARTARAEMLAGHIVDGILWIRDQFRRTRRPFQGRSRAALRRTPAHDDGRSGPG